MPNKSRAELAEWILDNLPSTGHLTTECVVEAWMIDVGEALVRETLERLENEGEVRSLKDGAQWRLAPVRKRPVVVAEVPGDPNFRRGDR